MGRCGGDPHPLRPADGGRGEHGGPPGAYRGTGHVGRAGPAQAQGGARPAPDTTGPGLVRAAEPAARPAGCDAAPARREEGGRAQDLFTLTGSGPGIDAHRLSGSARVPPANGTATPMRTDAGGTRALQGRAVPRTPTSVGRAVPKSSAALVRPNRVRPRELIPQRETTLGYALGTGRRPGGAGISPLPASARPPAPAARRPPGPGRVRAAGAAGGYPSTARAAPARMSTIRSSWASEVVRGGAR